MITTFSTYSKYKKLGNYVAFEWNGIKIGRIVWRGKYWSNSDEIQVVVIENFKEVPVQVQEVIMMSDKAPNINDYDEWISGWHNLHLYEILYESPILKDVEIFVESEKYNL